MRPILYEQNERVFDTNGMGILHDTISAEVTEARNGEFELELKYPIGGEWAQELTLNRYILVKPNDYDDPHAFCIYEAEKEVDSNQIVVKGVTKTDELAGNVVKPLSIKSATPSQAWEQVKRAAVDPISYNFISDIQTSKDTTMDIRNVLNAIAGEEGSFIDTWGGEIKRTNNTIYLYSKRGKDHVTTIRPRKNLKNVKVKSSMAGKFTRILPYVTFTPEGEDAKEEVIYGDIVKSPHYDDYFVKRIVPLDLSSEFNDQSTAKEGEQSKKKAPTPAQITAKAQSYFTSKNKDADKPNLQVEVEMLPLQDSTEWDRRIIQALEKIQLCDTVDVYVPKIDCDVTVKVRKIVYDALRERIIKIEASSSGSGRASLADQQKAQWQDLTNKIINNALYGEKDGLINTILTSANNKNKNFYGPDEPPREKVSKGDLWFKQVGGEGQVEMWRFDGENWVLVIDANFGQKVTDKVNDAIESAKRDINADVQAHINSAIADAAKRWRPDFTPIQNELDAKLRKLDDDINVKVTDIKDRVASEISNLTVTNPNLLKGTVDMSTIPESTVGYDNNWRRMDGIGGKYQEMSLGGYRYTGSNQNNGYKRRIVGGYPPGYFKKGKYVWSFYVKTNTPGFVLHTYCDPKVNVISDIRLDDVSVGTFSNNEFSFRLPDTEEHIISYHFEIVNESSWLQLGLLRNEADTVGAITDTYKWKVEEGVKRTPWCPNFQDPSPEWATYKQTNDSNLAELNKRVTSAAGETEVLKTRIEQTSNEVKITAQNLENRVNSSASTTAAELRVIKDSISAKVSRTDLDTVSGKVTAVETNLTAKIDGIKTTVDSIDKNVDGKITNVVSSAIEQAKDNIMISVASVRESVNDIKYNVLPSATSEAKSYTDTKFNLVDGKIQTQINNRLTDYARTADIATRVTQEAGKIKTELSSVIDQKIPKKYGSRNLLAGTTNPIHYEYNSNKKYTREGQQVLWGVTPQGYYYINAKKLKELGYKVGDRLNIQYKVKVNTEGNKKTRVIPEVYSNDGYINGMKPINDFGLPDSTNAYNFDLVKSNDYVQKVSFFNIDEKSLNKSVMIRFRIDAQNAPDGTKLDVDIKDVMMWAGDLWTDYAPAQDDIDPTKNEKFQEVLQTVDIYKRTLGESQNGIITNISQIVQNSSEIRSLITNASAETTNLIMDTDTFASVNIFGFNNGVNGYSVSNYPSQYGSAYYYYLSKTVVNNKKSDNLGFIELPLAIDKMENNETYTLSCSLYINTMDKYANNSFLANLQIIDTEGHPVLNAPITAETGKMISTEFVKTFTVGDNHKFNNLDPNNRFPFRIQLRGEGKIGVKDLMLVKSSNKGSYKPAGGVSSTVVTQRANSWALSLTGPKDVITSINADTSGVRLKGKNIVLDGDVIANGTAFIKESWIEDLNARKITSGQINAANIDVINLNASNIVSGGMSAARIRGGILSSLNGDVKFDLNGSDLQFFNGGSIRFHTESNAIWRQTPDGIHTAFLHFDQMRNGEFKGALYAGFGVTSSGDGINSRSSGRFAGIRCFRQSRSGASHEAKIDQIEVYGDRIVFTDAFTSGRGLILRPTEFNTYYDLYGILKGLCELWVHWRNGMTPEMIKRRNNANVNASLNRGVALLGGM